MGSGSLTSVLFCDLVASSTNIQVPFRRLPGRFLEGMKHVNRVAELRHVKDAVLITALFDTDLICPGPDRLHWLKICRLFASLDLVKLEACLPAGIFRECPKVLSARPNKSEFLHEQLEYFVLRPQPVYRSRYKMVPVAFPSSRRVGQPAPLISPVSPPPRTARTTPSPRRAQAVAGRACTRSARCGAPRRSSTRGQIGRGRPG